MPTAQSRLADEMDAGFMEIPAFAASVQGADYGASVDRVTVPFNTPLAVYLVSEHCTATHGIFSSNSGRYARVGIRAADGWVSPIGAPPPTAEDIAAHFAQIGDMAVSHEPLTVYDEFGAVAGAARSQGLI